jgi:Holliday junction resolvase RusA-like endonuclease
MTITGRPISKKNSRRNFIRYGKMISVPSAAYEKFENFALEQLMPHKKKKYTGNIAVHLEFYIKGKYRADVDNLSTSILDILEKSTIIENDNQVIELHAKKIPGCGGWSTKIKIEEL